jgi:hypothetical protein
MLRVSIGSESVDSVICQLLTKCSVLCEPSPFFPFDHNPISIYSFTVVGESRATESPLLIEMAVECMGVGCEREAYVKRLVGVWHKEEMKGGRTMIPRRVSCGKGTGEGPNVDNDRMGLVGGLDLVMLCGAVRHRT